MDIPSLKLELASMETRLTEMEDKIDSIDGKLTQVVDAILGNPLTKQGGFISEIEFLKEEIKILKTTIDFLEKKDSEHDVFKNRLIWTLGAILTLGAVLMYFTTIYANLFTQN